MKMKRVFTSAIFYLIITLSGYGQLNSIRVLFLGNSYTGVNNLPLLTSYLNNGTGNVLVYDSNTPGGHTLEGHSTNSISMAKIKQGNWDFVVLQEQSQIPTIPFYRDSSMYPALEHLNDTIKKYNPCAEVVTYMTWGRRFGGQQCDMGNVNCSPVFVDFSHMQDSLASAYQYKSKDINASIGPVGIAWKKVIEDTNIVLHTADNSHPNLTGSYLAACVFHAVLWQESPIGLSFNAGLSPNLALYLQQVADSIVFHHAFDWRGKKDVPVADFSYTISNDSVQFTNLSTAKVGATYKWDFGDNETSALENPLHVYVTPQQYTVSLMVDQCSNADTTSEQITVNFNTVNINEFTLSDQVKMYPNPLIEELYITSDLFSIARYQMEVINVQGQVVYEEFLTLEKQQKINLKDAPSGTYFVKFSTESDHQPTVFKVLKR